MRREFCVLSERVASPTNAARFVFQNVSQVQLTLTGGAALSDEDSDEADEV